MTWYTLQIFEKSLFRFLFKYAFPKSPKKCNEIFEFILVSQDEALREVRVRAKNGMNLGLAE